MSGFLNLSAICDQRKQLQLFNKPLPRYTPISPYPAYTQFQLNMRRKAEILRYSSNTSSSQTNNLTRKEKWAKLANAKNNKIIYCPNDLSLPTLSSSCDVPGPITVLYNDNTVPLYNFASNTASYAVNNATEIINYSTRLNKNIIIPSNTEMSIATLYIQNNQDRNFHTFSIETPIAFYIYGSNININNSGQYILKISKPSISVLTYYSDQKTLNKPDYQFNTMNTPIELKLSMQTNSGNTFSAFVYAGILNISNIELYTDPGFIYDIKLSFDPSISIQTNSGNTFNSNTSISSILNNTSVYMYTNLTNEIYNDIITVGGKPFNNTNPYNCSIEKGSSIDPYAGAILTGDF
jgi:hypothetical protein